jgi:hypothetical protein
MTWRAAAVRGWPLAAVLCMGKARGDEVRPVPAFNRWQEDWSVLADPALRTGPLDGLKYIPLAADDPDIYLSLGANLRERFEYLGAPFFGVGHRTLPGYGIQRLEIDADLRPAPAWQVFVQLQDDRAFGQPRPSPVDQDRLDLEQAFISYTTGLAGGTLKLRAGRQEIGFDLQRFVAVRDGPNVRQAFDALWLDWEYGPWRLISFWSHPLQYSDLRTFDDYSDRHLQYGGFRVEAKTAGPGALSATYSRYQSDSAHFPAAAGHERRDNLDVRYAGAASGFDWDIEAIGQTGSLGSKRVAAWAGGAIFGTTLHSLAWGPRLALQADMASGTGKLASGTVGTFNPLFPNGYYFTLGGFTGYSNLIHIKPSITVAPARRMKVMAAIGLQWRQTTGDAVYVQPDFAVPGTAGRRGKWTGAYGQVRLDYALTANLSAAVEAVRYDVGAAIRRAGGSDSDYVGAELKLAW